MALNNAVSLGIGLVPLVGDIALAVWRANSRNCKLLEEVGLHACYFAAQYVPHLTPSDAHSTYEYAEKNTSQQD